MQGRSLTEKEKEYIIANKGLPYRYIAFQLNELMPDENGGNRIPRTIRNFLDSVEQKEDDTPDG